MAKVITRSHHRHAVVRPLDVWVLYYNQDFFRLRGVLVGGTADDHTTELAAGHSGSVTPIAVAPSESARVNVAMINSTLLLNHSANNALTWSPIDTTIPQERYGLPQIAADRSNRDLVWATNDFGSTLPNSVRDALANQVNLSGRYGPLAATAYTSWFADGKPLYMLVSSDGGATYSSVRLDWLLQVLPTRMMYIGAGYGGVSYTDNCVTNHHYTRTASDPSCTSDPGFGFKHQNDSTFWQTLFCPGTFAAADNIWDYAGAGPPNLGIYVDVTNSPTSQSVIEYQVCTGVLSPPSRSDLIYFPPGGSAFLCPRHDGAGAYLVTSITWYQDTITQNKGFDGGGGNITEYVTPLAYNSGSHFPNENLSNYIYKVQSDLSYVRQLSLTSWGVSQAVTDLADSDAVFTINFDGDVVRYNWTTNDIVRKTITPLSFVGDEIGIFVTSQGTILIGEGNGFIHRSVDRGDNWTSVDVTALTMYPEFFTGVTESGGTMGTPGTIVIASSDNDGMFLYSLDDGVTWAKTNNISSLDYPESVAAR